MNRKINETSPAKIKIPVKVIEVTSALGSKQMKTDSKNVNVLINGESKAIPHNCSILKLLELYKISKDRVVIELNQNILKKEEFDLTNLKENDKLEIVTFVGGG